MKMTTFLDRTTTLGQLRAWYKWPYVDALTIQEAMNDMAMLVTGVYGYPFPSNTVRRSASSLPGSTASRASSLSSR